MTDLDYEEEISDLENEVCIAVRLLENLLQHMNSCTDPGETIQAIYRFIYRNQVLK